MSEGGADKAGSVTIRVADPAERDSALRLLFAGHATAAIDDYVRELLDADKSGTFPLGDMLVAVDTSRGAEGSIAGVGLFSIAPGAVALCWPPAVRSDGDHGLIEAILGAMLRRIDKSAASFGQCVLEPGHAFEGLLNRAGLQHVTDIVFYRRSLRKPAPDCQIDVQFQLETVTSPRITDADLADLLDTTYHGSLDCPEIAPFRSATDALDGHRATGTFEPDLSFVLRDTASDQLVAIVLLSSHEPPHGVELTYTGVAPVFRGRGLGRKLIDTALSVVRGHGNSLFLAVDERNHHAIRVYEQAGFQAESQREVWLYEPRRSRRAE